MTKTSLVLMTLAVLGIATTSWAGGRSLRPSQRRVMAKQLKRLNRLCLRAAKSRVRCNRMLRRTLARGRKGIEAIRKGIASTRESPRSMFWKAYISELGKFWSRIKIIPWGPKLIGKLARRNTRNLFQRFLRAAGR